MKRKKYTPRRTGENRISDKWVKDTFGKQYSVFWDGHSHYALDTLSGDKYYIFKKSKRLVNVFSFNDYMYNKK